MRRMTRRNRTGLTLVEVMAAVAMASIVLLATALVLAFGERSLRQGLQQATLQRDASYAMLEMKRWIRCANKAESEDSGQGIKVYNSDGWRRFWFVPTDKELMFQEEGDEEKVILDGVVELASFDIDPNTNSAIRINLELQDGSCEVQFSSTTMMRNYASGTETE